jgi:hypothetical protein
MDVLKLARVDWIPREREYTSSNKIDKGTLNRALCWLQWNAQIVDIRSFKSIQVIQQCHVIRGEESIGRVCYVFRLTTHLSRSNRMAVRPHYTGFRSAEKWLIRALHRHNPTSTSPASSLPTHLHPLKEAVSPPASSQRKSLELLHQDSMFERTCQPMHH